MSQCDWRRVIYWSIKGLENKWAKLRGLRRGQLLLVHGAYSTPELFDVYSRLSPCLATEGHVNLGFWHERKRMSCACLEEVS